MVNHDDRFLPTYLRGARIACMRSINCQGEVCERVTYEDYMEERSIGGLLSLSLFLPWVASQLRFR